jgi:predicted flap endonuclease-1-like 5' DNA nuclease
LTDIPKISAPANRALEAAGCTSLEDVARMPEKDVASLHGMGPRGIRILREAFAKQGLSFAKR